MPKGWKGCRCRTSWCKGRCFGTFVEKRETLGCCPASVLLGLFKRSPLVPASLSTSFSICTAPTPPGSSLHRVSATTRNLHRNEELHKIGSQTLHRKWPCQQCWKTEAWAESKPGSPSRPKSRLARCGSSESITQGKRSRWPSSPGVRNQSRIFSTVWAWPGIYRGGSLNLQTMAKSGARGPAASDFKRPSPRPTRMSSRGHDIQISGLWTAALRLAQAYNPN